MMGDDMSQNCSLEDSATLTTLGRTLKLVIAIEDLALTNKPLRANWDERKTAVLGIIKDVVAVNTGGRLVVSAYNSKSDGMQLACPTLNLVRYVEN